MRFHGVVLSEAQGQIYLYFTVEDMGSWGTVLLEELAVTQLVKKFPAFYGTSRFITVFTTAHHWSLNMSHMNSAHT